MAKRKAVSRKKKLTVVSNPKLVKPDIMAQLKEVWGDRCFTAAEVKAMRDFELEGEDG